MCVWNGTKWIVFKNLWANSRSVTLVWSTAKIVCFCIIVQSWSSRTLIPRRDVQKRKSNKFAVKQTKENKNRINLKRFCVVFSGIFDWNKYHVIVAFVEPKIRSIEIIKKERKKNCELIMWISFYNLLHKNPFDYYRLAVWYVCCWIYRNVNKAKWNRKRFSEWVKDGSTPNQRIVHVCVYVC